MIFLGLRLSRFSKWCFCFSSQAKDSDDDEEVVHVDRDHFMDEFFEQVNFIFRQISYYRVMIYADAEVDDLICSSGFVHVNLSAAVINANKRQTNY